MGKLRKGLVKLFKGSRLDPAQVLFEFDQAFSIGLKSGEYAANRDSHRDLDHLAHTVDLVAAKLSITTSGPVSIGDRALAPDSRGRLRRQWGLR